MTADDFKIFRKIVIRLILDTDLQRHFEIVKHHEKIQYDDFEDDEKRLSCLSLCLKCADIGHGAKKINLHLMWSRRITKEFYKQGELEEQNQLPVSQLCSKETDLVKSQVGFLSYLGLPMYSTLAETLQSDSFNNQCLV